MKIGIIGYFGYGNAGDEAMRELLLTEFPGSVSNKRSKIEKCDAYIIAGGDLVHEFTGLHMPKLWESLNNEPRYAISLGVRHGWESKKDFSIKHLKKFRKIYTRDQDSFDILSKYLKVDGVMPDLVLLADSPASSKRYPILLNYTTRDWLDPDGQFEDIVSSGNILPVALSPEYDTEFTDKIVSFQNFLSMAKRSEGVIGTRLHAIVMGVIAEVPVAGISYENKVQKFCQRYEIPVFEYGKCNGVQIIKSMKKAKINLNSERQKIREVISEIKKDLRVK